MIKLLHISDLHIHGEVNDKRNIEVKKVLDCISTRYIQHIILLTGDITDDGSERQYELAYSLLLPFKYRLFVCPGNHDYGAAGNFYSKERADRFDDLCVTFKQGGTFINDETPVVNVIKNNGLQAMLIALNSNIESESPFDFACGQIGKTQLTALDAILHTTATDMIKILMFHHHPFIRNDPFMEMKDSKDLARVIYSRVNVVLFGHRHIMGSYNNRWNIPFMLASDKTTFFAREITINDIGNISVLDVPVT
jgi:3',5'-cyclic AMP phosphodiesterase CpdA